MHRCVEGSGLTRAQLMVINLSLKHNLMSPAEVYQVVVPNGIPLEDSALIQILADQVINLLDAGVVMQLFDQLKCEKLQAHFIKLLTEEQIS